MPTPTPDDLIRLNELNQRRSNRALVAGAALILGVIALFTVVRLGIPGTRVLMGVNILLVWSVAILDQNWRRCPRCDFNFVPSLIRVEVEDTRECPRCGLNLDLLKRPPV